MLFHLHNTLWIGWHHFWALSAPTSVIQRIGAWTGQLSDPMYSLVMLFFVISGFCIHYPNAGNKAGLCVRSFYCRRFLRIYPPYFAAIFLSLAIAYLPYHSLSLFGFSQGMLLGNLLMLRGDLFNNGSLWSLPVEMELYLVYPLLYFGVRRFGWVRTAAVVSAVSLGAAGIAWQGAAWNGVHFPLYWIIWFSGMMLAEFWRREKLPRLNLRWLLAAIGAGTAAHLMRSAQPAVMWLPWGLCYFILTWLLLTRIREARFDLRSIPGVRCALFFGAISYSLYLTHAPV
ncbi:MAG TPA: acyltransferase, partial [Opitutaceae bacterium]|nr:acyltransferase [Opitutaceae bacterium]